MNPKYARFIRLISSAAILCSLFASAVHAAPIEDPPPSSFVESSVEVLPAWARSALSPPSPETPHNPTVSATSLQTQESALRPTDGSGLAPLALGDTIEVFTNTWSYSTIGLVYDPGRDVVRYAHESQSSSHNPTIYDVEYPMTHTLAFSFALSTVNAGWPWQIDNCTGAGYDFVEDTYFLPDYNGDLSYADDNIVEVDANGKILNAWEMDDEVGSNDSSDGSEIESIIDIAVVPGTPTRYFATAAYDDNVVYEIELTKTGTWWTPNSWRTVTTYTIPVLSDNLGIDYDAENERLYHSGWHTTTILITDLNMNPVTDVSATFDCPGAGGYNSGVTFIEGSSPPEIWVTDFSSDKTTRCEAPGGEVPLAPGWGKWIDGQPWKPDLVVTKQLSDVVTVTDVITAVEPFTLTESWDLERLSLVGLDVLPPVGQVITGTGTLDIIGPAGPPEMVTITKRFHVEPCGWLTTTLREDLVIEGGPLFEPHPVIIEKVPPNLGIGSFFDVEVYPGSITSFTLSYSNTGGYENDVWISNTFPITAPFIYAEPFPDLVGPDGLWTRWDVGDLANDVRDEIVVYVLISETVPTSSTITIWDGIFDHMGELQDETWITYHVTETLPTVPWEKLVNGEPWRPGISVTLETSQTFLVEEFIDPFPSVYSLIEEWNPKELALLDTWSVEPITDVIVSTTDGFWMLTVPPLVGPITITKEFHAEPCTWTETILWESLQTESGEFRTRPVLVNKRPPELWIDSFFDVSVYSREEATFTLAYSNTGGLESFAWIENVFPPEAPFVRSVPEPTERIEGEWAKWDLGELGSGDRDTITVTVAIADGLPPSTTIEIRDGIYNHAGELVDETVIAYHVPPPEWEKWVNGLAWEWDMGLGKTIETSDTITITDVISTRSGLAMVEHWDPERLALVDYATEPEAGLILSETGFLSWEFPEGAPGTVTITKWFHVEPCTWTYTVLWEELWVEDVEWERRPVHVDKFPPDLRLESMGGGEIYAGQPATFTLVYSNAGGYENDAWITNTFPISAPFASASLTPTRVAGDGTWAVWRLGGLKTNEEGAIDVTVTITESLVASDTIEIWDGIFHDETWLITDTVIPYHVAQPPHTWTKWIAGEPWSEGITVTAETSDTVEVIDVISTTGLFELIERWNPDELALTDWAFDPLLPDGNWFTDTGSFVWQVPPAGPDRPSVVTLTKWFHVEPCTWITTMLEEELVVQHQPVDARPVRFEKLAPELALTSEGGGDVYAGGQGRFTLVYSNTGGRENDVVITNTFPISAPLAWAVPDPDAVDPDGLWARWDLGDVDRDARETIEVTVYISATLEPSTTVEIWDGIYDHVGKLISETWATFHVVERPPITWYKQINGVEWGPELRVAVETFDPLTVTDVVTAGRPFTLTEEWDGARLTFLGAELQPPEAGTVISDDGWLTWIVTPTESSTFTLVKHFHVEPCTWTETIIWEELMVEEGAFEGRLVVIEKWAPQLQLESEGGGDVYAGEQAVFTLIYSNTGGYENDAWIENEFPPEAPFVSSVPTPTERTPDGTWVRWNLADLPEGARGTIDVTVAVTESLMTSATVEIWDGIFNHVGELMGWTVVTYHVAEPPYTWTKRIDGEAWSPGITVTVETSDTIVVTDVMSTYGIFELIERWNPDELALTDWAFDPPLPDSEWFTDTGSFTWRVPPGEPQVVTLTKWFHVEPCTWTGTVLWEELWLQGKLVAQRPSRFEKLAPELALTSEGGGDVYAGGQGRFTLVYSNTGGRENDVVITNTFPISAPLARAVPDPDAVDPDGLWARWDLGDLDRDARGTIEVTVYISETLEPSTTVEIWDGIYDHMGELISETWTTFHITSTPPITWHKWISDVGWGPEFWLPVETNDIFTVTDVISAPQAFALYEEWNAAHIALLGTEVEPPGAGTVISDDGWLTWVVTPTVSGLFTLTKIFHVEPCTWTETWLWEDLVVEDILLESRPVGIEKWAPQLQLESEGGGDVYAGEQAMFTLIYSNTGGYENDVWIWNEFPPEALFVSSDPPATISATNGITAAWAIGDLQNGAQGAIDVTVAISDALTPCHWITVTDWIYNHAGEPVDGTAIKFHVACKELTSVTLIYTNTGAIYTDTVVYFEADLAPDDATKPYTYTIDYGGGVSNTATSNADPLALDHTFDATGTFTVEIAAWNCNMVDPVTDVVDVEVLAPGACIDVRVDALQSDSPVTLGEPMHFTATVSGDPPITYTWDFGGAGTQGGTDMHPTFVYDSAGMYTVTLHVENDCPSTDSDSIQVTVKPVCVDVTGVSLIYTNTGTIYTDTVVHFSADIAPDDADKPYTYTIDHGSGHGTPASSSDDPLTFDHTFVTTGTHTVEVAVWNCEMTSAVTDDVSFTVREQGVCVSLDSITIGGATSGAPGTYTFTTIYEPLDASIPITYAWDNGDTAATSIRPLSVGTTTLMVTATNICTTVPVTDTHAIVISSIGYDVYLPLVMRNS